MIVSQHECVCIAHRRLLPRALCRACRPVCRTRAASDFPILALLHRFVLQLREMNEDIAQAWLGAERVTALKLATKARPRSLCRANCLRPCRVAPWCLVRPHHLPPPFAPAGGALADGHERPGLLPDAFCARDRGDGHCRPPGALPVTVSPFVVRFTLLPRPSLPAYSHRARPHTAETTHRCRLCGAFLGV